jgi:enoyl-CoA hydratase/carnithine racemase
MTSTPFGISSKGCTEESSPRWIRQQDQGRSMTVDVLKMPDGVAVVTLNRPEVLNALDIPTKERLGAIWRDIAADPGIRAVILRGAGPRAFCAGSDVKEMHRTGRMVSTETLMAAIPNVGTTLPQPVIAVLHGQCLGMGLTLALHCDMRIAAPTARLAFPEVPHGMISGVSAMRLPQVIPQARALEFLLLGEPIPLEEALQLGLINAIADDPLAMATRWAAAIAAAPAPAVQATKRLACFPFRLDEAATAKIEAMRRWVEEQDHFRRNAEAFERGAAEARASTAPSAGMENGR